MAKQTECRAYTVSVIGLSGTKKEKGQFGVGKSCLCNRFIHTEADLYHHEHISVLSQSDWWGRVINNDHFLYWGEVTKTDEGSNFTFHVIEQTEFVDDVSFQPFKTGRSDSYNKRCCQTKVQSAEKLMYICKDQLGMETDGHYEQKLMPDGRLNIDGILCCFDVSVVPQRTLDRQLKCCEELLHQAMKSKKPVVLVTTKSDQMNMDYLREIEKVLGRKEFKSAIPLVETSAHENVNVETPFLLLAHMMDKAKKQNKVIPYSEASKARKAVLHVAEEAFKNLLKNKITDFRCLWATARKKLEKESDYEHYVDMFGTERAKAQVKRHTRQLREDLVKRKQAGYLQRMPYVLKHFLPILEAVGDRRSWHSCREQMYRDAEFDGYFVKVCEDDEAWQQTDIIDDNNEHRMPKSLLLSEEVETLFRNHVNALQAAQRREQAKSEFWSLMEKHIDKPGGLLSDYYTQFLGKPAFVELDEGDRQAVFDEFQKQLKARLRVDFQELLWERPSVFRNLNLNNNLTEDDLNVIYNSLNDDQRFRNFHKLEDHRKVMLLNHVVFLDTPTVDRCFFHMSMSDVCRCTECQVSLVLRNERRLIPNGRTQPSFNSSGPIVRPLNLVILGRDGLASDLVTEIRSMCLDDEYKVAHRVYSLDYRPIEGDVSEEGNSFIAPNFHPDGCLCVYNSQDTLEYIRESLMQDQSTCLHNLPLVLMLAYEPYSQKELRSLQDDGRLLTTTLSCEFVDIPGEDHAEKLRFYAEQIEQAFNFIIRGPGHGMGDIIMEDTEPDLRLLLVMMCSDPYPMSLPLRPFLNEVSFVVTSDPETTSLCPVEDNVFTVDVTLDGSRQKVEVTVTSYHGAHLRVQKEYIYHGYILVYCPKRRASLASLKAFADTVTPALKIFIAIPEGAGSRYNVTEHSQGLKEGMDIAKNHKAAFLQASRNFETQTASQVYEKFLRDAWDHRDQVEDGYCNDSSSPPAYNFKEQSRRQETPLYMRNDFELVKPIMVKEKRDQFADGSYDTHGVARPEGTQGEIEWYSMYDSYRPSSGASRNKYALKPNSESRAGRVTAPLTLPEKKEIAEQYGTVKDAVRGPHPECDYALVMDALPDNKASDSEGSDGSSLERDKDLYTKVNRKPTPHKSNNVDSTLRDKLPNDVQQLDDKAITLFYKALEHGKEKVNNVRLMVVGLFGVGKTSLVNNLIWEFRKQNKQQKTLSTEGIAIHRCKLMTDGDWCLDTELKGVKFGSRINDLLAERVTSTEDHETQTQTEPLQTFKEKIALHKGDEILQHGIKVAKKMLETTSDNSEKSKASLDESKNEITTSDISEKSKASLDESKNEITVSVWDFAGQTLYYSTHQFFLNERSIYLVVMDMTRSLEDVVSKSDGIGIWCGLVDSCTYLDIFKFWLNAIHMNSDYQSGERTIKPTVILVGTRKDKMKGSAEEKYQNMKLYFDSALCSFDKHSPIFDHICKKRFLVNNLSPKDSAFAELRKEIISLAAKQDYWDEEYPVRWIHMERKLDKMRDEKRQIVKMKDVEKEDLENIQPLGKEALTSFLELQHKQGNIIFFNSGELKDFVVLAPQWIIEAFKCFIPHNQEIEATVLKDWEEYKTYAILKKNVLDEVMKNSPSYIHDYQTAVINYMEYLNVIAKPLTSEEGITGIPLDFHIVPCLLSRAPPPLHDFTSPPDKPQTPVLAFVFCGKFLPPSFFHRLVAVCIRAWPICQERGRYCLFNGLAIFTLNDTYTLRIWYMDYIIYARIVCCSENEKLDNFIWLFQEVRQQLKRSLKDFVHQSSPVFEEYIQCPDMKVSLHNKGLFLVKQFKYKNAIACPECNPHAVTRSNAMKHWFKERLDRIEKDDE